MIILYDDVISKYRTSDRTMVIVPEQMEWGLRTVGALRFPEYDYDDVDVRLILSINNEDRVLRYGDEFRRERECLNWNDHHFSWDSYCLERFKQMVTEAYNSLTENQTVLDLTQIMNPIDEEMFQELDEKIRAIKEQK